MLTPSHPAARPKRLALFYRKAAVLAFSLLAALAVPLQSVAQPGVLDSTFGTGGKLTYDQLNLSAYREGTDVAIQSDQKILISTRGSGLADIVRLNPNGTPDVSFGVGGVASAGVAGRSVGIYGIAVQSDGKIVVVGGSRPFGSNTSYAIVMRFDAAGALDTSFGTGGLTQTAVLGFDYARRVKIQPDGKIVVAVNAETGNGSTIDFAVVRYTSSGALDSGFGGGNGIKIIPVSAGTDRTTALALQPDEKIVVTGYSNQASIPGGQSSEVGVARLTADGSLDTSFGTGGSGIVRLIPVAGPNGVQSSGQSVGVQSDGKIVIGGYAGSAGSNGAVPYSTNLVLRLNANGTLDSGFGSGGVVTTEVADNQSWPSLAYDLALLPDGRIAVAGIARGDFSLVVYRANGSLDATFGTAGIAPLVNFASSYDRALAIAVQADGKFVLVGTVDVNAVALAVARYGAVAPVVSKPVVSNAGITRGYGDTVSYTLVATNSPTSYAATNLPAGLTLNPTTGLLSGTVPMVLGDYTINVSATNAGGTGTATVSLRVIDFTRPVITAPSTLQAEATSAAGAVITFSATAEDVISGSVAVTATPPSGSTIGLGTSLIQLSARDGSNNTATKQILVTVRDTTKPVLTLPAAITVEATSAAGAVATFSASASDLVAGALPVTTTPASGATFTVGTTTVHASATDGYNNTATGTFSVTVTDTTAPVMAAPANIVAEATSAAGAVVSYAASATDLVSGAVTVNASQASGSAFPVGTTTVTLTATDAAANAATASFTVTVRDSTPPTITAPANIVTEATSAAGAAVSFTASATDLVSGAIAVTASPASGSTFPIGATTVTLTATDAANNTTTRTFTVTVRDTTAPVIAVPANIVAEATSANGAAVSFTTSATDLVSGVVAVSASKVSGSVFPIGVTTVNLTATDAHGNPGTASFTVTVRDTTAPALTLPANQVLEATGPTGAVAVFTPTAADAVGVNSLTISAASGATFALGTTTINVVATDAAGNATNGAFTITVRDTTAPTIVVPANLVLNSTSAAGAVATFAASANDLVSGAVAVTLSPVSGSGFPIGTTTVTARSTDMAGNAGTRTFTVTVLSPAQQLANLIAAVKATPGLSAGEISGLTAKLEAAIASLARGNVNAAQGQIGAFVNQVEAFTNGKAPRLSAGQAQSLISRAQAIRNQL